MFFNWAHAIPKYLMVQMTTSVKLNVLAQFDILFGVSSVKCFSSLLSKLVKVVYVTSVMLGVVEVHDLARDDGF